MYWQRLQLVPQLPSGKTESPKPENLHPIPQVEALDQEITDRSPEVQYFTIWGCISFSELVDRTKRYATTVLSSDLNFPVDSIEDGLQTGYLRLWQRLQSEPMLLNNRPISWIGAFIKYGAWHILDKEKRLQQNSGSLEEDAPQSSSEAQLLLKITGAASTHSHESRQVDRRIDLQAAISATALHILSQPNGREQDRALWALYSMTMLHIHVTEASQLFRVRHQAMKKAFDDVRIQLQQHLRLYAPTQPTRKVHGKGQKELPIQDISPIRQKNIGIVGERYEQLRQYLTQKCPDTIERDLIALQGIQDEIPAQQQARQHKINKSSMQRAYERIHLLLAAQIDTSILPKRFEKKHQQGYTFLSEHEPFIQLLANELMREEKGDGKLIAMYAYFCNLPSRKVARDFNMSEGTVRRYRQNIQERFQRMSLVVNNS